MKELEAPISFFEHEISFFSPDKRVPVLEPEAIFAQRANRKACTLTGM